MSWLEQRHIICANLYVTCFGFVMTVFCDIQIGFQIKTRVQELGHGCIFLVQKAGALQITPSDSFTKRELIDCARAVTEKVLPHQLSCIFRKST